MAGKVDLTDDQESNTKLIQQNPELIDTMRLLANKHYLEDTSDYQRTYMFVHEIGHILGLAHFDDSNCNTTNPMNTSTIMISGSRTNFAELDFNKPQEHDKAMLRYLYGS